MLMRDAIQTLLNELRTQSDPRTSVFDLQIEGVNDSTLALSGRLFNQDQLTGLEKAFSSHFPSLSLDTASVRILSRESHPQYHLTTNLTGLYDQPTLHVQLSSEL